MFVLPKTRYTSCMPIARLRQRVGRCRVEKEMRVAVTRAEMAARDEVLEQRTRPQHNWPHIPVIKSTNLLSCRRGNDALGVFLRLVRIPPPPPPNVGNFWQLIRSWATSGHWFRPSTSGMVSCCGWFRLLAQLL